ncbi:uncharacterized protein VTP21DRAFT_7645 [Calcarisporiella thermophila]|uniref:uncharacterized protein n=1 Tax=Calcarisporiella thermophila TaxID=911321 RepID=UPI0037434901
MSYSSATFSSLNTMTPWLTRSNKQKPVVQPIIEISKQDDWKNVCRNIKRMDQLYDATFHSWVKAEENVLTTAMYLRRIANGYPMDRIVNALEWLMSEWRLESVCHLVRHLTLDWTGELGDEQKATLLRHITKSWSTQRTTNLVASLLSLPPYLDPVPKDRFLRAFTAGWDFSRLSELFMHVPVPHRTKLRLLKEAAARDQGEFKQRIRRLAPETSSSATSPSASSTSLSSTSLSTHSSAHALTSPSSSSSPTSSSSTKTPRAIEKEVESRKMFSLENEEEDAEDLCSRSHQRHQSLILGLPGEREMMVQQDIHNGKGLAAGH